MYGKSIIGSKFLASSKILFLKLITYKFENFTMTAKLQLEGGYYSHKLIRKQEKVGFVSIAH